MSLKDHFPTTEKESIEIACGVIKKLHKASIPGAHHFPHIKDWLVALDNDQKIPVQTLQRAREIRDQRRSRCVTPRRPTS